MVILGIRKLRCSKQSDGCQRCRSAGQSCRYSTPKPLGRPRKHRPISNTLNPICYRGNGVWRESWNTEFENRLISEPSELRFTEAGEGYVKTAKDSGSMHLFPGGVDLINNIDFELEPSQLIPFSNIDQPALAIGLNKSSGSPACNCLIEIFQSLDALSRLPEDLDNSIVIVRLASKTMWTVTSCTQCGLESTTTATETCAVKLSPNILVLGSLFPVLANAYKKLLACIDDRVREVKLNGEFIFFDLETYGGLWGEPESGISSCNNAFKNIMLSPDQWRITVRGLLRADIYGPDLHDANSGRNNRRHYHPGFWDILNSLKVFAATQNQHNSGDSTPKDIGEYDDPGSLDISGLSAIVEMASCAIKNISL